METLQLLGTGFVLLLVVAVAAVVWMLTWQLLKIRRDARSALRQARTMEALDHSIRRTMQSQGFSDDEIRDAIRRGLSSQP